MLTKVFHRYLTLRYTLASLLFASLITVLFINYYAHEDRIKNLNNQEHHLLEINFQLISLHKQLELFKIESTQKRNLSHMVLGKIHALADSIRSESESTEYFDENILIKINDLNKVTERFNNAAEFTSKAFFIYDILLKIENLQKEIKKLLTAINAKTYKILSESYRYGLIIWLGSLIIIHLLVIFIFRPSVKYISSEFNIIKEERDEARLATQKKSDYLSAMSHEIRTPLNSILGLNQLLKQTKLTNEQKEYIDLVEDSGDNLLQILNDIFDFSKIDYGQLELEEMVFSIHSTIEDLIEQHLPRAAEKNLDLLYIIEPDVSEFVIGDAKRLRQCIHNLINNSIKFTRNGEIVVRVNVLNTIDSRQEIQISVSDTGIGIPENKLKTLFNPFVHSTAPTSRRFEGSGLGLAISARLIELMKGRIWVESEMNKGTTFYIAVYFETQKNVQQLTARKDLALIAGKRVLIIDNNETSRKIITVQCHNWGLYPKSFSSAYDAFSELKQPGYYDLAIFNWDTVKSAHSEIVEKLVKKNILPLLLLTTDREQDKNLKNDHVAILNIPFKQAVLYAEMNKLILHSSKNLSVSADSLKEMPPKSDLKFLLAEDNLINQKLIERIMSNLGYTIDIAHDGLEALELANEKRYDIIFMDLQMPGMDGIEATKKILAGNNSTGAPRIIAMTANINKENKEQCFEAGMVDYVAKPINVEKLKQLIEYWGAYPG
ncbi:MAG: response regulator [Calditrichaeota bacterium]|nr:response regulator [Calditrichota bacterium]